MKLGFPIISLLATLLHPSPGLGAEELRLDEVVAAAPRTLVVRTPYEDHPLLELIHRAQLHATGAEASIAQSPPAGTRIPAGPVTVRQVLALAPPADRVVVCEISGADLEQALESAAAVFATYTFEDGRPLLGPGADGSGFVSAEGVSYEIDTTAPAGERVVHLTAGGAALDPGRRLRVAISARLARGLGFDAPGDGAPLQDALIAWCRRIGSIGDEVDHNWTRLPDYAATLERPLIDRLVRLGVAPREEALRLFADQPARRGDLAYWLARAYGWRETKLSGAFPDVSDSLEPWLDGLVKRRVVGDLATEEFFHPFTPLELPMALEWCERAALESRYALATEGERRAFRRGLVSGTSVTFDGTAASRVRLTRAQLLGVVANARFPVLRVLHTSDLHGAMEASSSGTRARGGSAVLAAQLARLTAENPEGTVLLDGGDAFQGTMISNLAFGRPMVEQMNRLGYAAMSIGNHEFDWSVDTLVRRVREMRFAALAANLTEARSGRRPAWARADTLFHRRGVRVGVFGLAYPGTATATHPRNVEGLRFGDDSTTAVAAVPALRRAGAEVVVSLGHVPGVMANGAVGGQLAALARGVRGVDLWLGGHSHMVVDGEVDGIPALIPGSHGEAIGVCDLVVDPVRDRVVGRRHWIVETWADSIAPDSSMAALVRRWSAVVASEAKVPVGHSAQPLGTRRGGESAIGSLVADVIREVTGADVALQNNGGLRAELPQGPVSRGAIYEVIPFENRIFTMDLTGAQLRQVLEEGLAHERLIQVSGIRYRVDLGRAPGSRVTALLDTEGAPLDEGRTYRVACNDFMASGGDDLLTLTQGRNVRDTDLGLRQALEDWVRERSKRGPLAYQGDGRVSREPGTRPPARGD